MHEAALRMSVVAQVIKSAKFVIIEVVIADEAGIEATGRRPIAKRRITQRV